VSFGENEKVSFIPNTIKNTPFRKYVQYRIAKNNKFKLKYNNLNPNQPAPRKVTARGLSAIFFDRCVKTPADAKKLENRLEASQTAAKTTSSIIQAFPSKRIFDRIYTKRHDPL
tara:strand:+ start:657 stop:998 length:342 start_codon:yes stop_codon:yes gene_type:complete